MRRSASVFFVLVLMSLHVPAFTHAASPGEDRLRLHIQQQHDALNLSLQQSIGMRADLSARDSGAVDRLQLYQRLERSQLEQQQLVQEHLLSRNRTSLPADALQREIESQRAAFALERQLQAQRFALDQQRLLQSTTRAPLQPPRLAGSLDLP